MTEICALGVLELAQAYRSGRLSPLEVTRAVLDRAERLNGVINAVLTLMPDSALAAAEAAERLFLAGVDLGLLQGVPVTVKDLFHVKGVRTTCASRQRIDAAPEALDGIAVTRLRRAGAVLIGKTNLHEFAAGVPDSDGPFGWVQNPRRVGYQAGSSSSGSAAAVAAGLGALSLGTDTAQSVRIPAALCGVVGLKPTYGRVPLAGVIPLSSSLDHVGPLARSVADTAVALQVLAGHDPADPSSARRPTSDYVGAINRYGTAARIGVPTNAFFREADADVLDAFDRTLEALRELGHQIIPLELEGVEQTHAATQVILQVEAAAYHERYRGFEHLYDESFRQILLPGRCHTGLSYVQARDFGVELSTKWKRLFQQVDVIATPTSTVVAPLHGVTTIEINGETRDYRLDVSRFTRPFSLTGFPAVALPSGMTGEGLPTSVQLVGAPFDEARLLGVAAGLERQLGVQPLFGIDVRC